jgi:hypothetical protein
LPLFGKKEEPKFWKYDAKYLGGHAAFPKETDGKLYLYPEPENKVVFESKKINMEIPFGILKDSKILTEKEIRARRVLLTGIIGLAWKKKHKMLVIDFEDKLGGTQSPVFESGKIDEISTSLYNLRLKAQSKA